jgi:hypothetical protein
MERAIGVRGVGGAMRDASRMDIGLTLDSRGA